MNYRTFKNNDYPDNSVAFQRRFKLNFEFLI